MIKQKIFNWILLVLVITTSLSSQVRMKQETKSYLWGLIKIPNDSKSEKVIKVKVAPFATPVTVLIILRAPCAK